MNKSLAQVLHVPSLFLAALLQLLPIARAALPVTQNAANIIVIIFRWAVGSTAVLGSVQAMSGASTRITNAKSVTATNGELFSLRLTTSPYQSHYWAVSNLPPDLDLIGKSGGTLWKIEGIPAIEGVFEIGLTAKDVEGSGSGRTVRTTIELTVVSGTPSAPNILVAPTNTTANAGENITLRSLVIGTRPMSFIWRRDGLDLPGATNSTLRLTGATTNDTGDYQLFCTNSLGGISSDPVRVAVLPVPLPLAGAGLYNGLFSDSNNVQHASAGFFTATVRSTGDFSARIQNGKTKYSFIGKFDRDGHATNQVLRVGNTTLTLEMHLDPPGGKSLSGRVTDGVWTSDLLARRTTFNAKTNPATALSGRYTLLIPGATDGAVAPQGDGAAAVTVTTAGLAALTGTLADGSKIVQRVGLSGDGDWPLYVPLYAGRGAVFGWLHVQPTNEIDLVGNVQWIRPAGPLPKQYTNGFILASAPVGSVYTAPIGTVFDTNIAWVIFTGGDLENPSANPVNLVEGGHVINAGTNTLALAVVPATGLFKGTVKFPEVLKPVRFQGAVLRGAGLGGGYFAGTNEIGHVYFGP